MSSPLKKMLKDIRKGKLADSKKEFKKILSDKARKLVEKEKDKIRTID